MAGSTTNISLIKPEITDATVVRTIYNTNLDTIDGRFSATYMAVQAKASVSITGGSITGITDLAIADGGTASSTAANARTALGLAIGTNVEAHDDGLLSIAGLTTAANKMIYTTALDTYAVADLSAFGRTIIDDADASVVRTTIGAQSTLTNEAGLYGALSDVSDFVQGAEANSIDSVMYVDASIDHEHLAPDVISGMTDVTSVDADYILIWDATDSALKKCDMAEVRNVAGGFVDISGTPVDNDFAKFTDPNTIEGRSYLQTRHDLQDYTAYPQDYAAGGTGTSGDPWTGDCIQAAINSLTTGVVYLREGYYKPTTDTTITLKTGITLKGIKGKSIIDAAHFSTAIFVIDAEGSEESSIAATANITTGDKTITISSTATLTAGDYVRIASDEDWQAGFDCGEVQQIRVIVDGTNFTLYNPVWDDYTTANNARVYELNLLDNIVVDGITIERGAVDNGYGMRYKHVRNSTIQNCKVNAADGRGIVFNEVLYSKIHNNYILDTNKTGLGYAIFIMNASQFNNITDNFIKRARRCISFGGTNAPAGLARFNTIRGNYFTGSAEQTMTMVATHELCEHVKFIDNTFVGDGVRGGLSIENHHTLISGNFFQDCVDSIVLHTESFYATVRGNTIFNGTMGIYIRGGSASEARYLNISDNFITATAGIYFLRYSSAATTFQEVYIKNNIIKASSYWMRADAAGVTLDDCLIYGNETFGQATLYYPIIANSKPFKVEVISVNSTLAVDHTYDGLTDSQKVGESVVFGELLYFNWTDKEWKKTDADASATMPGLRIALESKADGQDCLMLVQGYIRDDSAFAFAGSMVYASCEPGDITSTAPSASGDQVQRVGVAIHADKMYFNPSNDVGEI